MDCDTSITNITTARLRGIRTSCVGPGHRDREQQQRQHQQDRGQVPPARRPFGRNAFQQLHVREPQHPLVPGQLHDDVQPDDCRGPRRGTGRTKRVRSPTASSVRATVMSCASCHFVGSGARSSSSRKRSSAGKRSAAAAGDKSDDVGDPVPVGAQREQRRIAASQGPRHLGAVRGRRLLEVVAQLFVDGELSGRRRFRCPAGSRRRRAATRHRAGREPRCRAPRAARRWPAADASS